MRTAVVVFTRDLRLHDDPGLHAAVQEADAVVPLFVFDDRILAGPHPVAQPRRRPPGVARRRFLSTSSALRKRVRSYASMMAPTNCSSWRRLRHSNTPSQNMPYCETIESPVSQ